MAYTSPPEFQKLTEAEVEKALVDAGDNQVIQELARLMAALSEQYARLAREGKDPEAVLKRKPSYALEKIALRMVADVVRTEGVKGRHGKRT